MRVSRLLFTCRRDEFTILRVRGKGHTEFLTMARLPPSSWSGSTKEARLVQKKKLVRK